MNSCFLIGRLTRDPELRFTGSGKAVATFSIAVNRQFNRDETDFFRIVVWGKPGESCANYLKKGSQVGVQGRIQNNNYETNSGEKRTSTEIVADRVEFLSRASGDGSNRGGYSNNNNSNNSYSKAPANDNFKANDFSNFNDGSDGFQAIEDDDDVPF